MNKLSTIVAGKHEVLELEANASFTTDLLRLFRLTPCHVVIVEILGFNDWGHNIVGHWWNWGNLCLESMLMYADADYRERPRTVESSLDDLEDERWNML
jgi:hypothetical protein